MLWPVRSARAQTNASPARVVILEVRGHPSTGARTLDAKLRESIGASQHAMISLESFREKAAELKLTGRHDAKSLAEVGRAIGADYVLDTKIRRLGWLYTAHAIMIDTQTAQEVMTFKSGYYKPASEAADRAERIARVTVEKLTKLMAAKTPSTSTSTSTPTPLAAAPPPAEEAPPPAVDPAVTEAAAAPTPDELLKQDLASLRIVIPRAVAPPGAGAAGLMRRLRRDIARSTGQLVENDAFVEAQRQLNLRGRRRLALSNLVRAGQRIGAHYVLHVVISRSGWLYTAHARLLNTNTGEVQMDFRSDYYKPKTEAPDRGRRIARTTIGKILRLIQAGEAPIDGKYRESLEQAGIPSIAEEPEEGSTQYYVEDEGEGDSGDYFVEEAEGDFLPPASTTVSLEKEGFDWLDPGGSMKDLFPKWLHDALTFRFRLSSFGYAYENLGDDAHFRVEDYLEIHYDHTITEWFRLFLDVRFQIDDRTTRFVSGFEAFESVEDLGERRSYIDPREYYLHFTGGDFELRVGKQLYGFGKADLFSPVSLVNPWDFLDVLEPEPIAVPSASLAYFQGEQIDAELIFIPLFTPARIPQQDSRWSFFGALPAGVQLADRELPERDPDNFQYAVRVNGTGLGTDVSAYYFYGMQTLPNVAFAPVGDLSSGMVELVPVYDHIQMAGLDLSTTVGPLELHGEIAHVWTREDRGPDYLQWVVGTRWIRSGLVGDSQIVATLEYTQDDNTRDPKPDLSRFPPDVAPFLADQFEQDDSTSRNRPFPRAFLARIEFDLGATWAFSSIGQLVLDNGFGYSAYLWEPQIEFKPTETLKLQLKGQLIGGKADSFYGQYDDNDRLILRVHYVF